MPKRWEKLNLKKSKLHSKTNQNPINISDKTIIFKNTTSVSLKNTKVNIFMWKKKEKNINKSK